MLALHYKRKELGHLFTKDVIVGHVLTLYPTFKSQGFGGEHQDDCDYTPQSPPGRLQIGQVYEDCTENVSGTSKGMIGKMILHAPNKVCHFI